MNEAVEASQRVHRSLDHKVCSRNELTVETTRMAKIKGYLLELLHALDKEDNYKYFKVFSEAVLANYVDAQANKLPKCWKELCQSLCCPHIMSEPLVMQLASQQIFEETLTAMFKTYDEQPITTETPIILTADEENLVRYACGYVARNFAKSV